MHSHSQAEPGGRDGGCGCNVCAHVRMCVRARHRGLVDRVHQRVPSILRVLQHVSVLRDQARYLCARVCVRAHVRQRVCGFVWVRVKCGVRSSCR